MIAVEIKLFREGSDKPLITMRGNAFGRVGWEAQLPQAEIVDSSSGERLKSFAFIPEIYPAEDGPVFDVKVDNEGVWLILRASNGKQAVLSVAGIANHVHGHITQAALEQWAEDRRNDAKADAEPQD
jgi:hypothetical protein